MVFKTLELLCLEDCFTLLTLNCCICQKDSKTLTRLCRSMNEYCNKKGL